MKLFTLLAGLIIMSTQLFSQTYTNENMPEMGDSVAIMANNDMTVFTPGDGGEDVTWDFTTDSYPDEDYFVFVNPSTTPFADEFPEAVMCGKSSGGAYQYYSSIMNDMEISGFASNLDENDPENNIYGYFDPPINLFDLPLSYGDKQNSTYAGKYVLAANEFALTGTVTTEIDGSGTLITPAGTFENVLRIHIQLAETGLAGQQVDRYIYVSEDYSFWIALHEEITVLGDVNIQKWYAVNPKSLSQSSVAIDAEMTTLRVFPNPTEDMLTINSVNNIEIIQLFDAMGKVVATATIDGAMSYQMDVSNLNAGVYNVVTSSNGELTTTKFIKK
jgi:hypothetical protein